VIFEASANRADSWRHVRQLALLLVVLAVAHETIYLMRFGQAGVVPADAGHAYWPVFLATAALAVVVLAARARWRLTRGVRVTAAAQPSPDRPADGYAAEWRRIVAPLAPSAAALFLVVENVEHVIGHGHAEGLGIYLAADSILSLPIVLLSAAFAAAVGALIRWREIALVERLRQARRRRALPTPQYAAARWQITAALIRHKQLAATSAPDRAPPLALTA
jgi:hypothetical protein